MANLDSIAQNVLNGNIKKVSDQVNELVNGGTDPIEIINNGLIQGMNLVTPLFKSGEMFVPEVMRSAKAMNTGMNLLKKYISDEDIPSKGKVVIGTVEGDLHDIGKNLVGMMLETSGYTVIDLGVDVKKENFLDSISKYNPDIIGMSSLLTTTMIKIKDSIEYLKNKGIPDQIKIIIGGAPVSQKFADEVKADGYSEDASSAVALCDSLLAVAK
jgi:5-methyltetrahydrofolate--homocysteine methyltransferase